MKLTGGNVRNSEGSLWVGFVLLTGTLFSLMQTDHLSAQVETAVIQNADIPSGGIEFVAGNSPSSTPQTDPVMQLVDQAIEITGKRTLTANSHSPWQIFHNILAMRREAVLKLGNEKVNALEWLSTTEPQFDNQPWLLLTPHGAKFHPYTKTYYFEGHPSQFLALLSHSNLPTDYPFHVQGKVVTLADIINNTMKEVNTEEEVTWVLWALQHFLPSDATWVNQKDEAWSIERLVQIESNLPTVGTPCGGNHRLFALTRARDKYLKSGGKLRGAWYQADLKIKQHIEIARSLQNSDGAFSSDWYKGPNQTKDVNLRFNTTGHTMEFLAVSLPNERLNEPWVRSAVWTLSRELIYYRDTKIDCGPLFHSLDALILYRDRIRALSAPPEMTAQAPSPPIATAIAPPTDLKTKTIADPKPKLELPTTPRLSESIAKLPAESKIDGSESCGAPIPTPELTTTPEKTLQQKSTSTIPMPQSGLPKPTASANSQPLNQKGARNTVPQLDPAKLPNVGQAAPPRKTAEKKALPPRTALRDRPAIQPPALLPEFSETAIPLIESQSHRIDLQPGILAPEPLDKQKDSDPASALEPANP